MSAEGSILYRFKLLLYQARRRASQHRLFLLVVVCLVAAWIALNETFALKFIFERECLSAHVTSWKKCLASTLERWSHNLNHKDASKLHMDIINPCPKLRRVGHWQDGGWDVCVSDFPLQNCTIYSFGINDDPSFDQDLVKRWPQCTVFAFDPSIGRDTADGWLGENIHFYNIGLGGRNYKNEKGWDMKDLESIMSMLGHDQVDVLKMDIEFSEWQVFENWKKSSMLDHVDQLLVELHFYEPQDYVENIATLKWLRDEGFGVFTRRENFRYTSLIDIETADKEVVRVYKCLEVGWRRK